MVQVQSTWFPLYDRNSQKYVENIFYAGGWELHQGDAKGAPLEGRGLGASFSRSRRTNERWRIRQEGAAPMRSGEAVPGHQAVVARDDFASHRFRF